MPWTEEFNRQSNFVLGSGPCYLQLVIAKDASRCGVGRASGSTVETRRTVKEVPDTMREAQVSECCKAQFAVVR